MSRQWHRWILAATRRRFPLTPLLYRLVFLHACILMLGGHYTYAEVPLGFWMKELFGFARNHYDRIGHFAQGFVPVLVARVVPMALDSSRICCLRTSYRDMAMEKVNPNSSKTPTPEFLNFSIPKKNPNEIPRNSTRLIIGLPAKKLNPMAKPSQEPKIVGTIDKANNA